LKGAGGGKDGSRLRRDGRPTLTRKMPEKKNCSAINRSSGEKNRVPLQRKKKVFPMKRDLPKKKKIRKSLKRSILVKERGIGKSHSELGGSLLH